MSYKVLDCMHGLNQSLSDGIVKGVFDECSVTSVGRKVVIKKGQMVLSGINVLIDGREIIPIPNDYGDGRYYVVGVMKVKGGNAYSFYISLRDELKLDRSGLDCGDGVSEYLIAEVGLCADKVWARRVLPIINVKTDEKPDAFIFKKGFVSGENLNIADATSGVVSKISIFGNCAKIGEDLVGVTDFTLISKTGNLFDLDGLDVRDIGFDDKEGYYVVPYSIYGIPDKIENGFEVFGCNMLSDEASRGVLTFHYGNLGAGNYHFGFKANPTYLYDFLETECNVSVEVYLNGVKIERIEGEKFQLMNVQKQIDLPFEIEEDGEVEFKVYVHGHKVQLTDFYLSESAKIDYVDYGYDERFVEICDRENNAYELLSTGCVSDEIAFDGGECVLIKRVEKATDSVVTTRKCANYRMLNSVGTADFDGTIYAYGQTIVYELVEYKRIPLSEACADALRNVRTYRDKTVIDSVGSAVKPCFKVVYNKDVYSN